MINDKIKTFSVTDVIRLMLFSHYDELFTYYSKKKKEIQVVMRMRSGRLEDGFWGH